MESRAGYGSAATMMLRKKRKGDVSGQRQQRGMNPLVKMVALVLTVCSVFWLAVNLSALGVKAMDGSLSNSRAKRFRGTSQGAFLQKDTVRKAAFPGPRDQINFHLIVPFGKISGYELGRVVTSLTGQEVADVIQNRKEARVLQVDEIQANLIYENKMIWLVKDGPFLHDDSSAQALMRSICGDDFLDTNDSTELKERFTIFQNTAFACVQTDMNVSRGPAYAKLLGFRSITDAYFSDDNDVIMIVDGDDYLSSPRALDVISKEYRSRGCLCSWGSMHGLWSNQQGPLKRHKDLDGNFDPRHAKWSFSHPRTMTVKVAKHLTEVDFQDQNGRFVWKGTDRGFIYRMIELAGLDRSCFIDKKVYTYVTNGSPKTNKNVSRRQREKLFKHFAELPPSSPLPV